jgi:hypothetical protein
MCLVLQIVMFVFGIVTLIRGQIKVAPSMVVRGPMARLIGLVLLIPLPLAFAIGLVIGVGLAAQGKGVKDMPGWIVAVEPSIVVVCFILVLILGFVSREPAKKKRDLGFDDDADEFLGPPQRDYDDLAEPGKETGIRPIPDNDPPR